MLICDNDGLQLRYELFGDKTHPPIVLIAGAGAPAEYWPANFCEALSLRGYHVARFWHRDTGLSTHLDEHYPIDALVGDVLALSIDGWIIPKLAITFFGPIRKVVD